MSETSQTAFASATKRYGKDTDMCSLGRSIDWRHKTRDFLMSETRRVNGYMETLTSCPICSAADHKSFGKFFGLRYVTCTECGHLFGLDQLNDEGLRLLYSSSNSAYTHVYFDENQFQKRVEAIARPKASFVYEYLKPEPGKIWLDVGSSVGELLTVVTQMGWSAKGVETDPTAVAFAKAAGLSVTECCLTKDNVMEHLRNVQVVSLLNVLEHLKNPFDLLSAIAGGLEENAWILIEVPRHPSLTSFAMRAMPENSVRHIMFHHLHLFSEKSLEFVLNNAGFDAKAVWYFGQDYFETLSILHMTHPCEIPTSLLESVGHVQRTIDMCGLSDAMLVLAQRNIVT